MKYTSTGALAIVLAAILWSLDGLLRRSLYSLPPMTIVLWEHLLGFVLLLPFLFFQRQKFTELTKKQWYSIAFVSLLSGVLGTFFYTSGLLKIQFISFSIVVLLQQLQPIFAILAARILLKEPLTKKFLWLAVVAIIAAYFVSFPQLTVNASNDKNTLFAALFALLAAASWSISTAFSKYSLKNTSSIIITAVRFGFTPIFAFLFLIVFGQHATIFSLQTSQWLTLAGITLTTGLGALALYYFGLQRIPASRSTLLELAWPVSALFIGYFFLHERLTWTQWIGAIILVGTMILVVKDMRSRTE